MRRTSIVAAAALIVGVVAALVAYGSGHLPDAVPHLVVGWSVVGAGLIGWWRAPWSRLGGLLVVVGLTWFVTDLPACLNLEPLMHRCVEVAPLSWLAEHASWLWLGVLGQALLTFPTGRANTATQRSGLLAGYLLVVAIPLAPEAAELLTATWLVAAPALRRAQLAADQRPWDDRADASPAMVVGILIATALVLDAFGVAYVLGWSLAIGAAGLVRAWMRSPLDIGRSAPTKRLAWGGALAVALRDPGFAVRFQAPDGRPWVDPAGRDALTLAEDPNLALTFIERDGRVWRLSATTRPRWPIRTSMPR